jgi:integrase
MEKVVEGNKKEKEVAKRPYYGMTPWTPHDLRRTARTVMARIGIPDEHAEEVLNHSKVGIKKVYNTYKYDKEKQAALTAWEAELLRLLALAIMAQHFHPCIIRNSRIEDAFSIQ